MDTRSPDALDPQACTPHTTQNGGKEPVASGSIVSSVASSKPRLRGKHGSMGSPARQIGEAPLVSFLQSHGVEDSATSRARGPLTAEY